LIYFDTSAVVKLVVPEPETLALQTWIAAQRAQQTFASSQLLRIELLRTVRRTAPTYLMQAELVLSAFALLRMDDNVVAAAEKLPPSVLRSLDAIHLASAQLLQANLTAFVTYDTRLGAAAATLGLNVYAPS
jgi:uncharacterized protein